MKSGSASLRSAGAPRLERQEQKGWWCRKCDQVKDMYQKDCRCMTKIPEHECSRHRAKYWYPLKATLTVTMESANK